MELTSTRTGQGSLEMWVTDAKDTVLNIDWRDGMLEGYGVHGKAGRAFTQPLCLATWLTLR